MIILIYVSKKRHKLQKGDITQHHTGSSCDNVVLDNIDGQTVLLVHANNAENIGLIV